MGQHTMKPKVAVIFNPSKDADWSTTKQIVSDQAQRANYSEPEWIPTTAEDPGTGQTRKAIEQGVQLVIAAGGDGTVRLVAGELAGKRTRLGILPMGTGNIFARNMGIPVDSVAEAAAIAFGASEKRVDLGWVELSDMKTPGQHLHFRPLPAQTERHSSYGEHSEPRLHFGRTATSAPAHNSRHPFLVVGGVGFDAETMANTDATLKKVIGILAYFQAAIPNLLSRKFSATITAPNLSRAVTTSVRSVMFVNCPELNNGITLDPSADPADGVLNLNVLDIHGGLIGWADLLRRIVMSWAGLRSRTKGAPYKKGVGGIRTHAIQRCRVALERPHTVQVDGDVIGSAHIITVYVDSWAVWVRVPQS
ncbi:MAG: hypothetical protein MR006_01660 [Arcanobacterium sp.]|nr:hypothetical protein [Arcanobacterium sp.]